jgi:hypothetical protein
MLMSQTTTHGSLTPEQTQQFGSQLGNQSFWAGLLNGSTDFGTTYANTTYSDDVGTHDLSSAYNVNIFGGAALIGGAGGPTVDNPYPGCVTIGWLLKEANISSTLGEAWNKTVKSGEENGVFMVYEAKSNVVHVGVASQGVHVPDKQGAKPIMPNYERDYKAFVKSIGAKVSYLTDAHTHPLHSNYPSVGDMAVLERIGGPGAVGVIVTANGIYSLYSTVGAVPDQEFEKKRCVTDKIKMPSIRIH